RHRMFNESTIKRRQFLQLLGSGIAVTFTFDRVLAASENVLASPEDQLSSWIHVGANGAITVFTGKAEVGQNIRTSLAQIVAEELNTGVDRITMVMGDTDLTPYDRGTFGSRSIPYMGPSLRKAAATAREVLIDMANTSWKADRSNLYVEGGFVKDRSAGRSINIGELTKGETFVKPVDEKVVVTPIEKWKIAGTSVPKVNGASFVTGKHKYTSDMKLDGMLYGKVLRAPSYGSKLVSADVSKARQIPGVTVVQDGDFIGVTAPDRKTAEKALKAIDAKWNTTAQPSRAEIFDYIRKNSKNGNAKISGDVDKMLESSDIRIEQTFLIDYIAHVPLEPRAGLAKWEGDKLTVWTGTQVPFGVQEDLAEIFSISKEKVRVIQPDTGSGYGGKHTGEAGIEAARLSKAAGKPVKVNWSREEEFTWAYFRPAGVIDIKAGIDKNGMLKSWEFHNLNSGPSGIDCPYESPAKKIEFHPMDSPLRQGSYRGLAATANTFARECLINDLAVAARIDPLEFRLKNLGEQRMKDVLEAAAKKFGWTGKASKPGNGVGIACGTEKASYIATCAEVGVDNDGNVKVLRVVGAFECGGIINPNHLENQIQGSIIQGMGGALFEQVDFKDGKILNGQMSKYRVPRFSDIPQLEIVMVNRKDIPPAGAGETPILGIAPAIRNAIFNAIGIKLFALPLAPAKLQTSNIKLQTK
ncbi:MAG TPA: molybdopterin cofactor-binding domain-containing protein, partial [Cyclobacteriaceae bacterium]|nr:molybdopterin cofactor-binding domain-containing protein [Cyclobacteriaceae bacterium]